MRSLLLLALLLMGIAPAPARAQIGCEIDYYEVSDSGAIRFAGKQSHLFCPIDCPAGSMPANIGGQFRCLGLSASGAAQRRDCGYGLPCGPVPWALPRYPEMATEAPPLDIALTPTPTLEPTDTSGDVIFATGTPSIGESIGGVSDTMATMQALIVAPTLDPAMLDELGINAGMVMGVVRGVSDTGMFGRFQPIVSLMTVVLVVVVVMGVVSFIATFASSIIGIGRKIYHAVMDFIPL